MNFRSAHNSQSDFDLGQYMSLTPETNSLEQKERAVIKLAVSKVSDCGKCLKADKLSASHQGYTLEQIQELSQGKATFDIKLNALAQLSTNITLNRGSVDPEIADNFFKAGWSEANYLDAILLAGDKSMTNRIIKIRETQDA